MKIAFRHFLIHHSKALVAHLIVPVVALAFCAGGAEADQIKTVSGQIINGKITEETERGIKIQTTTGELILPKSRIQEMKREQVNAEEAAGDLAMARKDYYEALKYYEAAEAAKTGSATLAEKMKVTREVLRNKENSVYESLFQKASELSQQGDFEGARQALKTVLDQAPKEGPSARKARMGIAFQYLHESLAAVDRVQYQQAIALLQKGIEVDPENPVLDLKMARYLAQYTNDENAALEHYKKGIELANKYFALDPEERKAIEDIFPAQVKLDKAEFDALRFEKAETLFKLGKKQEAAEEFLALLQEDPKTFHKGTKYIVETYTDPDMKMDHAKLQEQLDVVLKLDKTLPRAWFLKGRMYLDDGDFKKAAECLSKTIELDPVLPETHYYRALAYLRRGENTLAQKDLEAETSIRDAFHVRCELGNVLLLGSEYDEALTQYNVAHHLDAEKFQPILGRARANRLKAMAAGVSADKKEELLQSAEEDIKIVLNKNSKNREAILEAGRLLKDQKKYEEAREHLKTVVDGLQEEMKKLGDAFKGEEKRLLAEAFVERGELNLLNGDKNQAQADFQESAKVSPDYAVAYNKLGLVAEKLSNFEEARTNYEKAIEMWPGNANFELSLAILFQDYIKDYEKALEHYRAFLKKGGVDLRVEAWIKQCENAVDSKDIK